MSMSVRKALQEFCGIVRKAPLHHGSIWLGRAGWEELCPEPRCLVFRHPEHKGVTIEWHFLGRGCYHIVAHSGSETESEIVEK